MDKSTNTTVFVLFIISCNDAWLLPIKGSSIKFYWKDTFFNRTRNPNYLPISRSIHSLKIQSKL